MNLLLLWLRLGMLLCAWPRTPTHHLDTCWMDWISNFRPSGAPRRGCCTRTPTASERMALWLLWLLLWTLLCVQSHTLTYHLDASLDGRLDGRLSLLWPTRQSIYMPTSSDVVVFIVRFILSLFNIRLKNFMCILNEFFAICEVYARVTKHGARVRSCGMCD